MTSEPDLVTHIRALIQPVVEPFNATVEAVSFNERSTPALLQITIDRTEGIESLTLDQVAEVSRAISAALDNNDPIGPEYMLEVSTPGAESEMTRLRHFQRNLGRNVRVKLRDGEKLLGRLISADEDGFSLELDEGSRYLEYSNVRKARPSVSFDEERR